MQIGIRAHDVEYGPLDVLIPRIRSQGFTCMHVALSKSIREFTPTIASMTPGLATYIRNLCDASHVDVAVLGNYLNLAHPDPDRLREITDRYVAHMRFASILRPSVVGTETGAVNAEYRYEPANHEREALDLFVKNVRPCVEAAEKFGVIMAIEPVWKHIVYGPEQARYVLDEVGSPNLQIIFDPVNMLYPGNVDRQDEIITRTFDLLKDDSQDHDEDQKNHNDGGAISLVLVQLVTVGPLDEYGLAVYKQLPSLDLHRPESEIDGGAFNEAFLVQGFDFEGVQVRSFGAPKAGVLDRTIDTGRTL